MTPIEVFVGAVVAQPAVRASQSVIVGIVPSQLTCEVEEFPSVASERIGGSCMAGVKHMSSTPGLGSAHSNRSHSEGKKDDEPVHRKFPFARRVAIRLVYDIVS